jgi:hypothetical protein
MRNCHIRKDVVLAYSVCDELTEIALNRLGQGRSRPKKAGSHRALKPSANGLVSGVIIGVAFPRQPACGAARVLSETGHDYFLP